MQRARTLTGLFLQVLRQRWSSLGTRGRILVVSLAVLVTAGAVHLASCAFGGCAAGPCPLASPPCHGAMQSDEPCPYAARRAAAQSAPSGESNGTPCHSR